MEDLINNLDLENMNYYYHITSKGFGNEIIDNGLYMEEKDLKTTTIKLPDEFLIDPYEYCKSEYKNAIVKRQEMIIIGCFKGEEKYIVQNVDIPIYLENNKLNYLIGAENILGYVDLETLNFIYNPEYIYDCGEVIKCLKI